LKTKEIARYTKQTKDNLNKASLKRNQILDNH